METLEARGHKQHYWVEENRGAPRTTPILFAAPPLGVLARIVAPPVRLDVEPPWVPQTGADYPTEFLRFECPFGPEKGGAEALLFGVKLDVPVSFEAFVEHHWSTAAIGYHNPTPEELVRHEFGGRPAYGYDWGTGVSEIFGWHIRARADLLIWAACEVYIPPDGGRRPPARDVSIELLERLVFLD
ncbi:Hypothetical protein A7982_10951 [Minicystis rosea]|nr:Hypothetical protein A7982_10951 [Minicystis rosea]